MNKTYKCLTSIALAALSTISTAGDQLYKEKIVDEISIRDVVSHKSGANESKIIIQPHQPNTKEASKNSISETAISYGDPLLVISAKNLPVTNDMCLDIDASSCSELNSYGSNEVCYNPCVTEINSLAYDKIKKILYFSATPTNLGTGGGSYFIFSANLNTKKITYLKNNGNPLDAELSPSGKYLLTYAYNGIDIYNTQTHDEIEITEQNIYTHSHERIYYLRNIKWLSDSRFSYTITVKHDKFQDDVDEMKQVVYDIPSKKIISSRLLDKTEYDKISKS